MTTESGSGTGTSGTVTSPNPMRRRLEVREVAVRCEPVEPRVPVDPLPIVGTLPGLVGRATLGGAAVGGVAGAPLGGAIPQTLQ